MIRSGDQPMAKIVLALATLGLAIGLGEVGVRLFVPSWQPVVGERLAFWTHDDRLGWAQRPGATGRFEGPGWDVEVRINEQGLRDIDHAYGQSSSRRVLVLGDSFGWGYGVSQDEGIVSRLRDLCPRLDFVNASVAGYGTDQSYLYYQTEGHRYEPDSVLLLAYENDLVEDSCSSMYGYPKPRFVLRGGDLVLENVPVPERTWRARAYAWLSAKSWLFSRAALVTGWAHRLDIGCDEFEGQVTQAILTRFARELRDEGVAFRLVLIPQEPGLRTRYAKLYQSLAARENVAVLDLAPPLAEAVAKGLPLTLPGNPHWNATGHGIAAEAVARALRCEPRG